MSFYDDTFDVEDALKGKPELEIFNRILAKFNELEGQLEKCENENRVLRQAIMIIEPAEKDAKD